MPYRILFDGVKTSALHRYMTADPRNNTLAIQNIPNSRIRESDWHRVVTPETDNPWRQYDQMKKWEDADTGFIRNLRLEKLVTRNPYTWALVAHPNAFRKAL